MRNASVFVFEGTTFIPPTFVYADFGKYYTTNDFISARNASEDYSVSGAFVLLQDHPELEWILYPNSVQANGSEIIIKAPEAETQLRNLGPEGALTQADNVYTIADNTAMGTYSVSLLKSRLPELFAGADSWKLKINGKYYFFTANRFNDDMYETDIPDTEAADMDTIRDGLFSNNPKGKMQHVQKGSFQMGNTRDDAEGWPSEKPVHTVHLTYDYYISTTEVTFEAYDLYCEEQGKELPSDEGFGRETMPAINISWSDAIAYCNWLSEKEGLSPAYDAQGNLLDQRGDITTDITKVEGYRLPTEAE